MVEKTPQSQTPLATPETTPTKTAPLTPPTDLGQLAEQIAQTDYYWDRMLGAFIHKTLEE